MKWIVLIVRKFSHNRHRQPSFRNIIDLSDPRASFSSALPFGRAPQGVLRTAIGVSSNSLNASTPFHSERAAKPD
jgi:hypothetical protein